MDTSSSISVARSVPSAASQKNTQEDMTKPVNGNPDRSALVDITNDSPIVGLAMGSLKTPSSSLAKGRGRPLKTPGSGEALLRGQVKTLLQRVEEETEIVKPPPPEDPQAAAPFQALLSHLLSPRVLLAPTPANTPQIPDDTNVPLAAAAISENPLQVEQMGPCQLNRALLFDSPDKSETSESTVCSALTYEGSIQSFSEKVTDDDCSSGWSTRANPSTHNEEDVDDCYEDGEDSRAILDELCNGLSEMSVMEFAGKHTRFVYNSDDEMEGEEVVDGGGVASPGVLVLKGLPVPEGKHLRFQDMD